MENIQNIKDYVEKTEIKKSFFGGYNKADVHKLLDTVLEMFETTLKEQHEKEEKRVADVLAEKDMIKEDAEEKSKMADALIVDLNKTIASLTDDIEKAEEKVKMDDALIIDLNKTIASLTDDIEKAEEKSKTDDALIVDLNKTVASLTDDIEKAEEKSKTDDALIADLNKTVASLTDDNKKAEEKIFNIKKEISNVLEMIGE